MMDREKRTNQKRYFTSKKMLTNVRVAVEDEGLLTVNFRNASHWKIQLFIKINVQC